MKYHNIVKKIFNIVLVIGMMFGVLSGFVIPSQANASDTPKATPQRDHTLAESETGLYIIRLNDPSVAMYMGGIPGLSATSPEVTGVRRLDPNSTASQAYLEYLNAQQKTLVDNMQAAFGHPIEVEYYYQYALNAVAVRISHSEALQAFDIEGVKTVYADAYHELDTDMGPTLIGAPSIWSGSTTGGLATQGEGIVVGMIDSGINSKHPSFAAIGPLDGYAHVNPYGDGVFHGYCASNSGFCNNKLIGAYDLYPGGSNGPEDTGGHGSHTSSTVAGNKHNAVITVGTQQFTRLISGVAPHANIVAYKVCNPSCPNTASVDAVNLAIGTDNVDVINYSISGGDTPWTDSVDQAFLDAFAAGIFVSASAGNDGPGLSTVAHTGPWNSSVAASTHSRIIANTLDITAAGGNLTGLAAVPGEGVVITSDISDNILFAGDVDSSNVLACNSFPANSFLGKIGLAQRGTCTFATKIGNLVNAGAVGVVIYNNAGGPPVLMGSVPTSVPSVMITMSDGLAVKNLISGDSSATIKIYAATSVIINSAWQDIMAGFSSRGPSQFELLKPDYTAPGVNILAAVAASGINPTTYGFYQGTSMSSPHSAGSAALMMALRPTWTVAEIRSAMSSTANPTPVKDSNGTDPANPYAMGSGRLNLAGAGNAGLVLDETAAHYDAANPNLGGDPKTLNQPSMVNYACTGTCSWVRRVTSVLPASDTWSVTTSGDTKIVITVSPNQFTLAPGASVDLTITANVTAGLPGEILFGAVTLTPATGFATHLPVEAAVTATPVIKVDPTEIVSTQPAQLVTKSLTITNQGNVNLNWTLFDGTRTSGWSDNFDSYSTGSQMHGQGGWKGWDNSPAAGALTSNVQARSTPNSVAILGASDLVHQYAGYSSGLLTYTAWQYIPSDFSGTSTFILLNTYNDGGPNNWSTQVNFDGTAGRVVNSGNSGGSLALIKGSWVELRVQIDLTNNRQLFYYNNQLLYSGTWTNEVSAGGVLNLSAVDLFANTGSVVYYDDISLDKWVDVPWLSTVPASGTTAAGMSSHIDVKLDATGLSPAEYKATLFASSNDPATPLIAIPVTMTVVPTSDLAISMDDAPDPVRIDGQLTYTLSVSNLGPSNNTGVVVVDTLPAGVTYVSDSASCNQVSGVVTCNIGALQAGGSTTITIVVKAPSTEGNIINTASVSGALTDFNLTNNTAAKTTTVVGNVVRIYLPIIFR